MSPTSHVECRGICVDYYCLYYYNVEVVRHLLEYTPSYSTTNPSCEIPKQICNDIVFTKELLRMFWDDEGSVSADGDIIGTTKSDRVARQLVAMHKRIGVCVSVCPRRTEGGFSIYVKKDKENLVRFKEIGFRSSVITRGKFAGRRRLELFNLLHGL